MTNLLQNRHLGMRHEVMRDNEVIFVDAKAVKQWRVSAFGAPPRPSPRLTPMTDRQTEALRKEETLPEILTWRVLTPTALVLG